MSHEHNFVFDRTEEVLKEVKEKKALYDVTVYFKCTICGEEKTEKRIGEVSL